MGRWAWKAVLIVAALPLAGCISGQKRDLAECGADGGIQACMEAKGYIQDFENSHCASLASPVFDPYCYRPRNWFSNLGVAIEKLFSSGPPPPPGANG
jgi:hypothetical protein